MKCLHCGSDNTTVIDSRPLKIGYRRRRYKCLDCGTRFTTMEVYAEDLARESVFSVEKRKNEK